MNVYKINIKLKLQIILNLITSIMKKKRDRDQNHGSNIKGGTKL